MKYRPRGLVPALAFLLAAAALQLFRLDAAELARDALAAWSRQAAIEVRFRAVGFTLFPAPGLRLRDLDVRSADFALHSADALIDLRLMPLLLGKAEIDTLTLPDARIRLPAAAPDRRAIDALIRLPLARLRLIRAQLLDPRGRSLLDEISLDLRDPGPNREMLWELQAGHGERSLRAHGRLDFRRGHVSRGFGKFRFRHLNLDAPLALLSTFRRAGALPDVRRWRASGALTLRITRRGQWSVFGEADLAPRAPGGRPVHLRGKIEHRSDEHGGSTRWRDSFIHIGERGVIALEGRCAAGACRATQQLRDVPLARLLALLPQPAARGVRIDGRLSGRTRAAWSADEGIRLTGRLRLDQGVVQRGDTRLALPPLTLARLNAEAAPHRQRLTATLTAAPKPSSAPETELRIDRQTTPQGSSLTIALTHASAWPEGVTALIRAALLAQTPELRLEDTNTHPLRIAGLLWRRDRNGRHLTLDRPAFDGALRWGDMHKPAGLPASCRRIVLDMPQRTAADRANRWTLDQCRLGGSRLGQTLRIVTGPDPMKPRRLQADDLHLDFDALTQAGMRWPAPIAAWRGRVEGDLTLLWPDDPALPWPILSAKVHLQDFGTADWRFSGPVQTDDHAVNAPRLQVRGPRGRASLMLKMSMNPADRDASRKGIRGEITVLDARLNAGTAPAMPAWMRRLDLHGHIEQAGLRWLGQDFRIEAPAFTWRNGELLLPKARIAVAGGMLEAKDLHVIPPDAADGGLRLRGLLRASRIRLERLRGLDALLHARLSGSLHANLRLDLTWPGDAADWRGDGDLLVFSGAWLPERGAAEGHRFAFRRLDARFRLRDGALRIPRLSLISHGRRYRGQAMIAQGRFSGEMRSPEGVPLRIDGAWPIPEWHVVMRP